MEQTTEEETLTILHNIKDRYEEHHNVTYTEEALAACVKLAARYITDRSFPDKAIDILDEAGSRVHINNISVPKGIEDKEKEIDNLNNKKNQAVANEDYNLAADIRDQIKKKEQELEGLKQDWESSLAEERETVEEGDIAQTVSMMTGVPVTRMANAEGSRLKGMKQYLRSKVIAQDSAVDTLSNAIIRSRVGLKDPNSPIGTFMFLGPTGVN